VGAQQPVRLLISSLVDVPTVVGWLRPAILVPVEFLTGVSFEHITALLAHELAHIRRYDYLASVLQSMTESVLFYHPAVWWISEQIRAERELCCDDLAVAATGDVLAYARALADLESRQPARLTPALAANGGSLVNRVRRLIEPAHAIVNSAPGPGAAWAMTLLWLAGVGLATVHATQVPATVVKPVAMPVPRPVISLAGTARNVLLYDPLLSAGPARSRDDSRGAEFIPQRKSLNEDIRDTHIEDSRSGAAPAANVADQSSDFGKPQAFDIGAKSSVAQEREDQLPARLPVLPPLKAAATPPEPPLPPTFHTAAKLVQVDVIARNKTAPAVRLSKEDFTLLDNGKPQRIASFSVTSLQTPGRSPLPLPTGAVSNRLESRGASLANATVLLIDRRNTEQASQVFTLQRIVKFLRTRRNSSRTDRMGIYTFGRDGLHAVQEITDDAELLGRAAENLRATDPSYRTAEPFYGTMVGRPAEDRRRLDTKYALQAIARHLASVPGRKGLIWIAGDLPLASDFNPDMEEAARALNDADVALYAVDARGLEGALSGITPVPSAEFGGPEAAGLRPPQFAQQLRAAGGFLSSAMTQLADMTGGLALCNTNGIEDSIKKALDDAELTYTLGFYPGPEEQSGGWHKLKVEVASARVKVRFREKYFAPGPLSTAADRPTLPDLLKAPLDATQLQVVAETMADRARPNFRQVRASVDLHEIHLVNQNNIWVGAVDVSFLMEGSRTARTVTRKVEIPDQQLAAALMRGIVVDDSIGVDGQTGELRIVAQDRATGAAGSVRVPLGNK
jgi:VWFA-related protein